MKMKRKDKWNRVIGCYGWFEKSNGKLKVFATAKVVRFELGMITNHVMITNVDRLYVYFTGQGIAMLARIAKKNVIIQG